MSTGGFLWPPASSRLGALIAYGLVGDHVRLQASHKRSLKDFRGPPQVALCVLAMLMASQVTMSGSKPATNATERLLAPPASRPLGACIASGSWVASQAPNTLHLLGAIVAPCQSSLIA